MKHLLQKTFGLRAWMMVVMMVAAFMGAWADDFELYSGTITEGDYIIVYNGKAMKNTVTSNRLNYSEVAVTNDKISTTDASIVWHIAASSGYWTIYNASVSKYAASNGTKNQAALNSNGTDNKSLWTVTGSSTYEFVNKNNSNATVNANLRNNGIYGFACYSTSTGGALSLYKKSEVNLPEANISIESIDVNLSIGGTNIRTAFSSTEGATISYTSDDESIAIVNASTGEVTAVSEGSATITATASAEGYLDATASYTVNVSDTRTAVNLSTFTATNTTLIAGGSPNSTITSATNDQPEWTAAYTYSSDNEAVATVDENGVITAVSKGTCTITCSLNVANNDASYKAGETSSMTIEITINNPSHTATFSVNGEATIDTFEEDEAITFPINIADINGKTFVGWVANEIPSVIDEAPDFVKSATMGDSDAMYYAVFATKSGSVEPKTLTITPETENFPTSYADANDYTLEGKKFNILQAYINGSKLQWRKYGDTNGTGTMYNVDALSNIQSIVLTYDQSDNNKNFTVVVGYTKNPKNVEITPTHTGSVYTYDCSSGDTYNYFVMTNGSGAGYLQSITINYQEGSMSLSGYCTTVAADTRKDAELSFSLSEVNAAIGADFEQPTLNTAEGFNGTVEYSSSDENVAQIADGETGELRIVGEGTTTITATFEGNDDFKRGSASYTLTVTDNRIATTISQEPIELDLADIATLTRLAPVVKDAEGNVVEYTNDPNGEGLPEVYFDIVSDENGIFGSFDSHGNIVLNSVEGTATIKAVYNNFRLNETYKPSECTFTITVTDSHAPGAVNNPYTIAQAIDAIDAGTGVNGVYATGIVSNIVTAYSTDYGNITFDISDDGQETSDQLRAYRCVGNDAANVQAGDIVVVYGNLIKYGKIYEFAQNNQLVSLKHPASISITPDTYNMDAKAGGGELPVVCKNLATDPQLEVVFVDADGETVVTYDWITAVINENGNIDGQITANTGEARTAYFYVKGVDANGDVVKSNLVTFTQEPPVTEPFITVNTETWDVDYNGGDKTFGFDYDNLGSNPTFAVQFFESNGTTETECSWISARFATDDNKVTIIAINNDETSARTAYFKIYAEIEKTKVYSNLVTINQAQFVVDYAELPFEFDGGKAAIETTIGLTQEGLGSDYGSSPKLKFDGTDDYVILKINERPGTLTFDIKGNGFSGGTFTVQTSEDGETYTDLETYTELGNTQNAEFDDLGENVRYIKWIYTEKVSGNVALGNITLAKYEPQLPEAGLSFGETTTFTVEPNATDFTAPTLTTAEGFDGTVVYSSSDEDIALVDENTGEVVIGSKEGTATITASSEKTENFKAGEATYTITVKAPEKAEPEISFAQTTYIVNIGAEFTAPELVNPNNLAVTYASSNEKVALVDETTGVVVLDTQAKATVTITASFAGDDTYKAGSASYTIKVVNPNEDEFDLASFEDQTSVESVEGVIGKLETNQGSNTNNAPKYYANGNATRFYKGNTLVITSQTKEIVSVELVSSNSTADKFVIDNANYAATIDSKSDITYVAAEGFRATSVTFNLSEAGRLTKVVVTYADHTEPGVYVREKLTVGNWGTICLPYDARVSGATLYTIAGVDDTNAPSTMYLAEASTLEAGKPYFFQATENVLTANYTSGAATKAQSVNGLVGTLEAIVATEDADPLEGMYLLSAGQIVKCGTGSSLAANRAYINMTEVGEYTGDTTSAGVKVFYLGGADAIRSLDADNLNGAVIYDLSGRRLSKAQKGLYIVNGKKVSVK